MKHGVFKKYFIGVSLVVVVSIGVMLFLLFITYNNHLSQEKISELKNACDSVCDYLTDDDFESSDTRPIYYFISHIAYSFDCDVYVTDNIGKITVCSCNEYGKNGFCEHTGSIADIKELKSIASGNEKIGSAGIYPSARFVAATYFKSDKNSGYVFSSASSDFVKPLIKKSVNIYLLCAIAPLIIIFVSIYIITYRMNKPLKLMSEAAHAMSKGDFSKRIPVTSDDEIGELAASFNKMTNSLARLEEARKSFIANVSHEMRTPMTTIGGFIDGIIDGTIEPEKQNYYLNIASQEVKRLSRMIQSMLNLSRLESSEFVLKSDRFDLREQILSIVISQEQRIEKKHIEIRGLDTISSVTVTADKDLIYQAVYNLVDNAIKFVNDGGYIFFSLSVDDSGAGFTITNSGSGIPRADLPLIFDRFYKLDKSRSANKNSMGLGLYIVKTIIKNHGGTISVSSRENEFTSFKFILPIGK